MLKLSNTLINVPVMSLRTGGVIGTALSMIINPNNLKVEGWHVQDKFSGAKLVLVASEVRDVSVQGLIINDQEVLSETSELVRLRPIIDIGFDLLGKQVVSQSGKKYGKVSDYAMETESLIIKKIYAHQSIIKNFTGGSMSIDRTQIIDITKKRIVIEDPYELINEKAVATTPVNS